jgi:hypothetical protein
MIDTQGMSPDTIRKIGLELLSRELGPDGMIEFLQQYSLGTGDYTKEREVNLPGETGESLLDKIIDFQKS